MEEYRRFIAALMWTAILFSLIVMMAAASCMTITGCTSVRYVPVESVTHDSIYISRVERDSIHVHDSIYMEVVSKADTIYKTKYVQKVVYRDALRTDTMMVERVDTIRLPYPVERPLSKWEEIKLDLGGIYIVGLTIFALSEVAVWLLRRKRNNI